MIIRVGESASGHNRVADHGAAAGWMDPTRGRRHTQHTTMDPAAARATLYRI